MVIKRLEEMHSSGVRGKFGRVVSWLGKKFGKLHSTSIHVRSFHMALSTFIIIILILGVSAAAFAPKIIGFIIEGKSEAEGVTSQAASSQQTPQTGPAPSPTSSQTAPQNQTEPNFKDLPNHLMKNTPLISDLPDKTIIYMRFFTFETGKREWQKEYIVKQGEINEGKPEKWDIEMIMHSKYVNRLYLEPFCNVSSSAKKSGDLAFNTEISSIMLAWKFRGLIEYKKCII